MEKQLNELGQKENAIVKSIKSLTGSIEVKEHKARQLGIFDQYSNIHDRYTNMNCIESLKRAVFIQWYGSFEPLIYTGIDVLSKENEIKNIDRLIELIRGKNLDEEFTAMISYYYSLSDWYFNSYEDGEIIQDLATKKENRSLWKKKTKYEHERSNGSLLE
jgi:hypothetical protein